jgi:hypothetical protein
MKDQCIPVIALLTTPTLRLTVCLHLLYLIHFSSLSLLLSSCPTFLHYIHCSHLGDVR